IKSVKKPDFFRYLPSKNFISVILALLVIVGGFWALKIRKPESKLASSLKSAINQDFLDKLAEGE
ncbi:MAG: hypothetical protein COZ31_10065, partial [Nitrospirae bacterium CG_4_10_14_3_um_filter_44_29]